MKLIKACCVLQTTFANIQFCLLSFRGKNAADVTRAIGDTLTKYNMK
jgi:hypothetical protein